MLSRLPELDQVAEDSTVGLSSGHLAKNLDFIGRVGRQFSKRAGAHDDLPMFTLYGVNQVRLSNGKVHTARGRVREHFDPQAGETRKRFPYAEYELSRFKNIVAPAAHVVGLCDGADEDDIPGRQVTRRASREHTRTRQRVPLPGEEQPQHTQRNHMKQCFQDSLSL
jgi:hypothetical protein